MLILRRTLLLWMFMFWQGGFFFYAAVVVKVGTDAHGTFGQGLVTRHVTWWLNVAGFVVLAAWLCDLIVERASCWKRRWAAWAGMLLTLIALIWLHPRMDALIEEQYVSDEAAFYVMHRCYLWISTIQWGVSVPFTYWTLRSWRAADRNTQKPQAPG